MLRWWKRIRLKFLVRFVKPARFRRWIELEEIKEKIIRSIRHRDADFPDTVFSYLGASLGVEPGEFEGWYWEEVISLMGRIYQMNLPPKLPIIEIPSESKKEKDTWDYAGRTWHLYSHLLAKEYGWSLEYIRDLNVVEAIAKIQEILTDEQLEREFQWDMSERSVSYNPKTKTSKYNELPRPYWMKKIAKPAQKMKMATSMLPAGVLSYEAVPEELRPKEVKSAGSMEGL